MWPWAAFCSGLGDTCDSINACCYGEPTWAGLCEGVSGYGALLRWPWDAEQPFWWPSSTQRHGKGQWKKESALLLSPLALAEATRATRGDIGAKG